jgi:hypothetical protein
MIGNDKLATMGYDSKELLAVLEKTEKARRLGIGDAFDILRVHLYLAVTSDKGHRTLRKLLIPGMMWWTKQDSKK